LRSNLKHLVAHYNHSVLDGGQHPLSKIDALIIEDLLIAVGLLNKSTPLVEILECWKNKQSDDKIRERLEEFILTLEAAQIEGTEEEEEPRMLFLEIQGHLIPVKAIFRISKHQRFDSKETRIEYQIIINGVEDLASKKPAVSDLILTYYSEEQRDDIFVDIQTRLKAKGNIKFV
jgi:hypothetical protein